jgi:hypothetical protein
VSYAFEARLPVPLEGLAGSDEVFSFSVSEATADKMLNRDGVQDGDRVLVLRDRETGQTLAIGAAGSEGRAIVTTQQPPFSFPAVATDHPVVAFLEAEGREGTAAVPLDENGDGDRVDSILRVFRRDVSGSTISATEVTANIAPPVAVDGELAVNGQSLALSNGRVFFRATEADDANMTTTRVSLRPGGIETTPVTPFGNKFFFGGLAGGAPVSSLRRLPQLRRVPRARRQQRHLGLLRA